MQDAAIVAPRGEQTGWGGGNQVDTVGSRGERSVPIQGGADGSGGDSLRDYDEQIDIARLALITARPGTK